MHWLMRGLWVVVAAWVSCSAHAQSSTVFDDGFELAFGQPASDAEAARFLNQATFGATAAGIAQVRSSGIPSWVELQMQATPTLSRPFLETLAVNENLAGVGLDQGHRVQRWVHVAVTAPDQLRQRTAWALGQIVVVSDQNDGLSGEPVMMAEWNDLLVRNAFGNYRALLGEALRSPMMGRYLTHLRNRKFEITPRCRNLSSPGSTATVSCTSSQATANGTQQPVIVEYQLPTNGLITPDENFARELMQLFSIGLVQREPDFDPIIDPETGVGLPTYSQSTVTTLSRLMTGLGHACSGNRTVAGRTIDRNCGCSGIDCSYVTGNFFATPPSLSINGQGGLVHPDRYEPMLCYPRYHDTGRDRSGFQLPGTTPTNPVGATIDLAPGQSIPGGTPDAAKQLVVGGSATLTLPEVDAGLPRSANHCDALGTGSPAADKAKCLDYCNSGLTAAVDLLFNHPNTAVMVSRQLIQRLVSSTPSKDYIARVAAVFADNGQGVRGDLRAVVKAVLFDIEARRPIDHPDQSLQAGKPREPLLKMIHLWRAFGAVPGAGANYPRWPRYASGCSRFSWPQCAYQQRPLGAPSVFNFFEPDYRAPGAIADLGLYSPELQIINENSSILTANDLYNQLCAHRGSGSNHNCHGPLRSPLPTDHAHFPDAQLDGLPGGACGTSCTASDDAALIEVLDVRLYGGAMSGQLGDLSNPGNLAANTGARGTLFRLLRTGLTGTMGETVAQNARRREILYLIHLAAVSPEYATQR